MTPRAKIMTGGLDKKRFDDGIETGLDLEYCKERRIRRKLVLERNIFFKRKNNNVKFSTAVFGRKFAF